MHIQEPEEKVWIQEQVEGASTTLPTEDQRHILGRLNAAEAFEKFLGTKYVGQKRFGIEGAESAIPVLDAILEQAAGDALDGAVLGMAHRGRLNVLSNIVGKSLDKLFTEFEGYIDPDSTQGSGDVKYHLGQRAPSPPATATRSPSSWPPTPATSRPSTPSWSAWSGPARTSSTTPRRSRCCPCCVHGDAAFAGQGVVAETLNLSSIKGYRVGGTIHLIINNQLGFTTAPDSARSSEYCTDVAKMVQAPIFHVNGDDPEACVRVARLAYAYRQRFHKDVVIDMVCYRRHGHNEGDDPSYTQPLMYKRIDARRSVRKLYTEALVRAATSPSTRPRRPSTTSAPEAVQSALEETRVATPPRARSSAKPPAAGASACCPTSTPAWRPRSSTRSTPGWPPVPEGFTVHPKLDQAVRDPRRHVRGRRGRLGHSPRRSPSARCCSRAPTSASPARTRGAAPSRSATRVLVDYETGAEHAPLAHLAPDQGKFWIYDSLLSEYAAMGFEYGYSVVAKHDTLVLWEAQFGDFVNGAQIVHRPVPRGRRGQVEASARA